MTWTSLRSGMASTGVVATDRRPARMMAAMKTRTRNRLLTDHSMIFSIIIS
jgi:hypothetical protein